MNKTVKTILALAIGAVAFTSCSSDDDSSNVPSQKEIESKIIGNWKNVQDVPTNKRIVLSFTDKQKSFTSCCLYVSSINSTMWFNKIQSDYNVVNQNVNIRSELSWHGNPVSMEFDLVVNKFEDDLMNATLSRQYAPSIGVDIVQPIEMIWKKVTADYSQDIIGLWEGVAMTGDETYGDFHHRILYKADGTYVYYSLVGGEWQPLEDVFDEWNVDGDWLATRWQNQGSDVMNYEWWDIDYIKDGTMKWSALREKEDGTRFTTTFTWKKIVE